MAKETGACKDDSHARKSIIDHLVQDLYEPRALDQGQTVDRYRLPGQGVTSARLGILEKVAFPPFLEERGPLLWPRTLRRSFVRVGGGLKGSQRGENRLWWRRRRPLAP
jgi:hypothetical protein